MSTELKDRAKAAREAKNRYAEKTLACLIENLKDRTHFGKISKSNPLTRIRTNIEQCPVSQVGTLHSKRKQYEIIRI